ncbi:MAG TPA: hypothetical protein VNO31_25155 [Umezawaea sp.]|nr:hypothetical protein [Umezawaea sp.]
MSANLLTLVEAGPLIAAAAVPSIAWALASLGKTVVQERSRTARLAAALKDSAPAERGEILRAWGQLESARPAEVVDAAPEEERLAWFRRLFRGGRGTEPGKD